jgi:hypothetical protein
MQCDVFQKYFLMYSHFGVVCDSFWRICKFKVSSVHSVHRHVLSLLHSDLSIIIPFRKVFRSVHKNSSWLWKLLLWRFATCSHTCFIRGCCSGGLWYFTGVLDVIMRHMASFPARRLKMLAVYKAYVISQHAFTVDRTLLYVSKVALVHDMRA